MNDVFETYRPMLDLIGHAEGTDRRRGYDETLGYGQFTGGDRALTSMTLDQIDELQRAMLQHPDNAWNSSALGRYQIVRSTLNELRQRLHLAPSELFDAALQDRLAVQLLRRRGVDRYLDGKLAEDLFIDELAKEWASLPTQRGVGHYGGQKSRVSVEQVRAALADCRRVYDTGGATGSEAPAQQGLPGAAAVAVAATAAGGVGASAGADWLVWVLVVALVGVIGWAAWRYLK